MFTAILVHRHLRSKEKNNLVYVYVYQLRIRTLAPMYSLEVWVVCLDMEEELDCYCYLFWLPILLLATDLYRFLYSLFKERWILIHNFDISVIKTCAPMLLE